MEMRDQVAHGRDALVYLRKKMIGSVYDGPVVFCVTT